MRSSRIYFALAFIATVFSCIAFAEELQQQEDIQIPFIDIPEPIKEAIHDSEPPEEPVPPPIWSLCGHPSKHLLIPDENGVTIEPAQPLVGENITVTVKGRLLKRVTGGEINIDLRLMKFIKVTPTLNLCEQLESDLFEESHVSCPLEEGPVTLIAKKYIPEEVPKVSVTGNITLTNQDNETLTCVHIDVVLQSRDGKNRYWFF